MCLTESIQMMQELMKSRLDPFVEVKELNNLCSGQMDLTDTRDEVVINMLQDRLHIILVVFF